jgi:hypothetical protein
MVGSQHNQAPQHSNHVTRFFLTTRTRNRLELLVPLNERKEIKSNEVTDQQMSHGRTVCDVAIPCTKKRRRSGTLLEKVEKQ